MKITLVAAAACALVLTGVVTGGHSAKADTVAVKVADPFKDCMARANTTLAMGECIIAEHRRVDAELNSVYQQLVKKLDASRKAQLVKVEQSWIVYRDDECNWAAQGFAGGSAASLAGGTCQIDLTVQRTKTLREHLEYVS